MTYFVRMLFLVLSLLSFPVFAQGLSPAANLEKLYISENVAIDLQSLVNEEFQCVEVEDTAYRYGSVFYGGFDKRDNPHAEIMSKIYSFYLKSKSDNNSLYVKISARHYQNQTVYADAPADQSFIYSDERLSLVIPNLNEHVLIRRLSKSSLVIHTLKVESDSKTRNEYLKSRSYSYCHLLSQEDLPEPNYSFELHTGSTTKIIEMKARNTLNDFDKEIRNFTGHDHPGDPYARYTSDFILCFGRFVVNGTALESTPENKELSISDFVKITGLEVRTKFDFKLQHNSLKYTDSFLIQRIKK